MRRLGRARATAGARATRHDPYLITVPGRIDRHTRLSDPAPSIECMTTVAEDRVPVARLREGSPIEGVFACTRKDRMTGRNGTTYLAIELRDRTGALPARVFRDADFHAGRFDRGDLVRVSGRVERFREELQAELREIARVEDGAFDPAEFLPAAYRDIEELDGFLEHLAREVHDPALAAVVQSFTSDDAFRAEFR